MAMSTDTRKWWALGALNLAVLTAGLDSSILNLALPTLAGELHASETDMQWFSSGYLLTLAAAMLPMGVLGDRYGRRKVLMSALLLFGAASTWCALCTSSGPFIAARLLLGVAGAGVIVMSLAALTALFDPQERPKAIGIWSATNFLAAPLGPLLGGWLLEHYWWGWVFLINVPVAAVGLIIVFALVPETRAEQPPGLDIAGLLLSTGGLVILSYGFIRAGENGWAHFMVWLLIIFGLVALGGFAAWEIRLSRVGGTNPLVDTGLFRSSRYTWGVILLGMAILAMVGVLFVVPQYFQGVQGASVVGSGLRLLPLIVGLTFGTLPAARIARRIGAKFTIMAGFGLMVAGFVCGGLSEVDSAKLYSAIWMGALGVGMGLAMATATSAALAELSADQGGIGSAVLQAVNKVGGPFGSAIIGSILAATYQSTIQVAGLSGSAIHEAKESIFAAIDIAQATGSTTLLDSARHAFVRGMDTALFTSAGLAGVGMVMALVFMPQGTPGRELDGRKIKQAKNRLDA
ncbi:MFS transporter [Streptomyces hayashii]|uniref:MFS transporter n=1 Tax=Streptomyces hayashii TaxID=2839966 RepID=UPI00403CE2D2